MRSVYVAVCGPGRASEVEASTARLVGRLLAEAGAVVVTGGLGGVMEAVSEGAREAGGVAVGILPGDSHVGANPHCSVTIPTGLGEARNALIVRCADALIAVGGEYGTLSEIAFALKTGVAVVGIDTWEITGVEAARTPEEAVGAALGAARSRRGGPQ